MEKRVKILLSILVIFLIVILISFILPTFGVNILTKGGIDWVSGIFHNLVWELNK